jgi:hypothetical protein
MAGLWPFNFYPKNKVKWLENQSGLDFYGQAIVYSVTPVKPLSIELSLQAVSEEIYHIGHIFSFVDENGSEIFFIGQWKSHLLVGKGTHGKNNYREMGIRDILKKGERRLVTVTSGSGTNIYVDGILLKSNPRFQLVSTDQNRSGRIVLGNSATGREYWTGHLFSLAIDARVLTKQEISGYHHGSTRTGEEKALLVYHLDERSGGVAHDPLSGYHLVIPPKFEPLKKTILTPPWEDFHLNRSYLKDILTNILGFIPFGFFLSAYLRIRKPRSIDQVLLISLLIGGSVSLSIELIQVYLPTRNSQLTDVITNILGTGIGVFLFFRAAIKDRPKKVRGPSPGTETIP